MQRAAKLALSGVGAVLAVVVAVGLQGCAASSGNSSASNSSTSNMTTNVGKAVTEGGSEAVNAAKNAVDEVASKAAENENSASEPAASESSAPAEQSVVAGIGERDGKQTLTGTVRCTTYADRAKEVNWQTPDFDNQGTLTLIELPEPVTVTTYKGGSEWTGEIQWIKVPDDESIRRFKDQQITIGVDKWGNAPSDISGVLYDLVLTFDYDGLVVFED